VSRAERTERAQVWVGKLFFRFGARGEELDVWLGNDPTPSCRLVFVRSLCRPVTADKADPDGSDRILGISKASATNEFLGL